MLQQPQDISQAPPENNTMLPPVSVIEDPTGITLYADLPGVAKEKLNLQIEGETLTIEGEIALDMPQEMEPTHAEIGMSHYRRGFTLSRELDLEHVEARLENGVLKLRIPKASHAQPRKIDIRVS